jgi:hypothetical protein
VKRDPSLVRLSRDHNRGLVIALHIERALPAASDAEVGEMCGVLVQFWSESLLPHFRAECECLLARLVRRTGLSDELISRTTSDHLRFHSLMAAIRDEIGTESRRGLLGEAAALLREHIRWEEAVLFEATQTLLEPSVLTRLSEDLAQRIPEEPPPPPWPR